MMFQKESLYKIKIDNTKLKTLNRKFIIGVIP